MTVRFAKSSSNEQNSSAASRNRSYEYQKQKSEEEPWVETTFHNKRSEVKWKEESQKLFCNKMDQEIMTVPDGDQRDYLKQLAM